ncbi:helix-turn-helix domain-containing protein [Streptomyces sp. NPDC088251]|uniref:helix-turn-helix domain-containing protein n=1 Tax=unclassified Streptomyces TaxID=2593676 RepID=UPI003828FB06
MVAGARIRLEAVGRFESGAKNREIVAALRVGERSVERRRRQWRERQCDEPVRAKGQGKREETWADGALFFRAVPALRGAVCPE